MAVHFSTRLKTRFIPLLFVITLLASVFVTLARASDPPQDDVVPVLSLSPADASEDLTDELRTVMSESVDPRRLDRRPGFSPIVYAPRVGERPWVGAPPVEDDKAETRRPLTTGAPKLTTEN